MEDYLSQLNDQQRDAVVYCDGPQLVIAGAGSGKTRVLTYKIVHLLAHGFEPWRILALTFTNKAAREMRQRIQDLVGQRTASKLWMGTFHSIFARILRANAERVGFKPSFTIYDASDSKSLIKLIIKEKGLDDKIYKPGVIQNSISWAKNALITPADYALERDLMEADVRARRPLTCEIYADYMNRCLINGAMDFDDLLLYTNILFRDNPDVLRHYQEFFRYILVDEYQDTNFAQHLIVSQLARGNGGLVCVVGDDAQSIYSFRGANISNILDLKKSYPNLETFKLERNYRSTQNIINAANSLIAKNTRQIPKDVYSLGDKGSRIEVVESYSDYEESFLVANRISQVKMRSGDSYEEFAILYRTNAQSRVLEESLRKRNIPYRIYGGLSFYQRKEVKDAIAYFRLSLNPDDDEALRRVINFPSRGIGDTTVNKIVRAAIDRKTSMWQVINDPQDLPVNNGTLKKLEDFAILIKGFIRLNDSGATAYEVASTIISRTHLLTMFLSDKTPESISKQENLEALLAGVQDFIDQRTEEGVDDLSLASFLAEVSLATDQDSDDSGEGERVTLMTVHAAKGLEFGNVFIVGVEEELFPSAMASDSLAAIEEERRLLYVAITRAKRFCMVSYAGSRFRNGQTVTCRPSRFLSDISSKYLNLSQGSHIPSTINPLSNYRTRSFGNASASRSVTSSTRSSSSPHPNPPKTSQTPQGNETVHTSGELTEGMKIRHPKFGVGTITKIDTANAGGERINVNFENTGTRTLLLRYARFEII